MADVEMAELETESPEDEHRRLMETRAQEAETEKDTKWRAKIANDKKTTTAFTKNRLNTRMALALQSIKHLDAIPVEGGESKKLKDLAKQLKQHTADYQTTDKQMKEMDPDELLLMGSRMSGGSQLVDRIRCGELIEVEMGELSAMKTVWTDTLIN